MARKKISKKDLVNQVARLSKKLAKTTTRLKKQKSGLSGALSSLQKQVADLRRKQASKSKLAKYAKHQQDLTTTTGDLVNRLRYLEETTSLVERAGYELKGRIEAVERTAAEILHWQKKHKKFKKLMRRLDDRSSGLSSMQGRLDRLTIDLNKLWAKTDGMGVGLSQQTSIATLLGQSRDELSERIEGLANELRAPAPQDGALDDQSAPLAQLSGDESDIQEKLDGLADRCHEQAEMAVGHDMRLHDLEQVSSILERFADEFGARVESLEVSAAEAKRDGDELTRRTVDLEDRIQALPHLQDKVEGLQSQLQDLPDLTGPLDRGFEPAVEALGNRTQAVEEKLSRLSDLQDKLELQTALLSRQAEQGVEAPILAVAQEAPGDRSGQIQSAEELVAQVEELQRRVAQQTQERTELGAHYQGLEATANKLSEVQLALLDRVDRVEQRAAQQPQGVASDQQPDFAELIPKLLDRCSMTEEAADKLSRRAAVLEAKSESLARTDEQLSRQLEAVQQRLSELFEQPGRPAALASVQPDGLLESLEPQISSLIAEQSANQAHIEEFLGRIDALEMAGGNHTEQTDALASRVAALAEGLQGLLALKAGQRFDDLDLRGDTLERSLQQERERVDELEQANRTLGQRLDSTQSETGVIEGLVSRLSSGKEKLDAQVEQLGGEVEATRQGARRQQEQLEAQDARLAEQQQRMDAALSGHDKTTDSLNNRLGTLGESQQAIKEATASLGVQQTRQSNDTQNLQQSLKQRSLLGGLMLLLLGATIAFLLLRAPAPPEAPQLAEQQLAGLQQELTSTSAGFKIELADVRQELSRVGASVVSVSDSVEQVYDVASPELPERVTDLAQSVDSLAEENSRQQQENAKLITAQQQLQAEMERMAGEVKALEEQVAESPTIAAVAKVAQVQRWAKAQRLGRFTVQVVGVRIRNSLGQFIKQHGLEHNTAIYRSESSKGYWYVLLHGIYETAEQAQAAVGKLPPELAVDGPWVRRLPERGELLPL